MELFSSTLEIYSQQIENIDLLTSIKELREAKIIIDSLKPLFWKDGFLALPLSVNVSLPPLGNYKDIDIRAIEPIILVFNLLDYPYSAPMVFPDRLDFPKNLLAHLYIGVADRPPGFCLVRGGMDEWFAGKRITDVIIRTQNWLRDAAVGELSTDGNQFEPFRLENYNGAMIYDYDVLHEVVLRKTAFRAGLNFGMLDLEKLRGELTWTYIKTITHENLQSCIVEHAVEEAKEEQKDKRLLYYGYIIWADDDSVQTDYDTKLPRSWSEFQHFCKSYNIDTTDLEQHIISFNEFRQYNSIPIVVAIKRPKPLIGFSVEIELLNFHVRVTNDDITLSQLNSQCEVKFKQHIQPFTNKKAREISGYTAEWLNMPVFFGCGALGSKIILHLAKSGLNNLMLVDPDKLMPHNFARHGLSAAYVGKNKAEALASEIRTLFADNVQVHPLPIPGLPLVKVLAGIDVSTYIYDFTASDVFLMQLIRTDFKKMPRIVRGYISDFGNLGLLFFEGEQRNPRIDDLQSLLYAQALTNSSIADWLQRESENGQKTSSVLIGVGCNSETTILSDEVVASHAANFSGIIKNETKLPHGLGQIFVNRITHNPFFQNNCARFEVESLDAYDSINKSPWQVRIKGGLVARLKAEMIAASPRETGGVLIGRANFKTHTIHVVDILDAPPDSKANETCFYRGIEGLQQSVAIITELTGGQIGYIGEWHSHPNGPDEMSFTDLKTVQKFQQEYEALPSPLPVFMLIVSASKILPYVF